MPGAFWIDLDGPDLDREKGVGPLIKAESLAYVGPGSAKHHPGCNEGDWQGARRATNGGEGRNPFVPRSFRFLFVSPGWHSLRSFTLG